MIVFDGISLNSVAKVDIDDIYVSPIAYDEVTRPRAIRGGSDFVRSRAGTRTVSVTFALLDSNMTSRQASLMAISEWAKNDKEYRLDLPGHPNHYLMAICSGKPEPSLRQWWESKLRLVFTCYENPYWNSIKEKSVACGTDFHVLGDAPPLMWIERDVTSAVSNQSYSDGEHTITFSSVPAGNLVIDLEKQIATVSDSSIMQYYQPTSRFLIPKTGNFKITGTGTVKYRERWQ